jgi:hypothetical protein
MVFIIIQVIYTSLYRHLFPRIGLMNEKKKNSSFCATARIDELKKEKETQRQENHNPRSPRLQATATNFHRSKGRRTGHVFTHWDDNIQTGNSKHSKHNHHRSQSRSYTSETNHEKHEGRKNTTLYLLPHIHAQTSSSHQCDFP